MLMVDVVVAMTWMVCRWCWTKIAVPLTLVEEPKPDRRMELLAISIMWGDWNDMMPVSMKDVRRAVWAASPPFQVKLEKAVPFD